MKRAIIAAVLFALTSPAFARNYNTWDCGSGVEVAVGKWFNVSVNNSASKGRGQYPGKGSFNFKWDLEKQKILLNGKACEFITERMDHYRGCTKGDADSCEALKGWEPNLTKAEKQAIERAAH